MHEIEIYRQIIASCDEALRDVFLRRMEASISIARSKLDRGEPLYDAAHEKELLDSMSRGLPPELALKARMLWKSLLRMSRNRQCRVFLELDESLKLWHEDFLSSAAPQGPCCCTAGASADVKNALHAEPLIVSSPEAGLDLVKEGKAEWCAVPLSGFYKTDWLYDFLNDKQLYLNEIVPLREDAFLAVISRKLIHDPSRDEVICAVFNMPSESGSLAYALSILADNKQNMEFLHMQKKDDADDMHQFFLYLDFDGCLSSMDTRAALYQLQMEMPYFRIVGCRRAVDLMGAGSSAAK